MRAAMIIAAMCLLCAMAYAKTINVPANCSTIQSAIDTAINGDTVLVAPGSYVENIDFLGKEISVKSSDGPYVTVIDGHEAGSVVTFSSGSGENTVLDGFTITNGIGTVGGIYQILGGGIFCNESSPTITNNVISGNHAGGPNLSGVGGGVYCSGGNPVIDSNVISNNTAERNALSASDGGGIYSFSSELKIANNSIVDNQTNDRGGGIFVLTNESIN